MPTAPRSAMQGRREGLRPRCDPARNGPVRRRGHSRPLSRSSIHDPPPLLRPHALRQQAAAGRRQHRLRRRLHGPHRAGHRGSRTGAAARRRGAGRRHHPQAHVRAAHPVRVRGGRPHRRQRQRLLRAGRAPRHPAGEHGAAVRRGRSAAALRRGAAARPALPAGPRRQAERRGHGPRGRDGAARGRPRPHARQPAVPAGRGLPGRAAPQDRRVPRAGGLLDGPEEAARRGAPHR